MSYEIFKRNYNKNKKRKKVLKFQNRKFYYFVLSKYIYDNGCEKTIYTDEKVFFKKIMNRKERKKVKALLNKVKNSKRIDEENLELTKTKLKNSLLYEIH